MAGEDQRFSTPSYDPNIPIVSSSGGTIAAYKDPKSPESIIKKTTEINAQASVDSKYDVQASAHEGFHSIRGAVLGLPWSFFIGLAVLILFVVYVSMKKGKGRAMVLRAFAYALVLMLIVKVVSSFFTS